MERNVLNNKNLLVVTPRYPLREGDSYNIFVKEQVDELKKYFNKVVVIATTPYIPKIISHFMQPRRIEDAKIRDYSYDNIDVYYTKDVVFPIEWHKLKWGNRAFKKSTNILRNIKFRPDIIHAHFIWPSGNVAVKLGKEYGVPVIITGHGYDVYDLPFRSKKWFDLVKYTLDNSYHIITVSKSNYDILVKRLMISKEKITIIPNGFNNKIFKPLSKEKCRESLFLPTDKKIILSVGNLVPVKGHVYLLKAMKKVIYKRNDTLLIIIGSGPLRSKLEDTVKRYELSNYIIFKGHVEHNEIPLWMNAADIFVLPSLSEGNPTVMFESLGVGLPFVGTTVGGIPEIINSEDYGILCPPADSDCLAEKILMAFEKNWNRDKIIKYAQQFTWENITKEIMKIYYMMLGLRAL